MVIEQPRIVNELDTTDSLKLYTEHSLHQYNYKLFCVYCVTTTKAIRAKSRFGTVCLYHIRNGHFQSASENIQILWFVNERQESERKK